MRDATLIRRLQELLAPYRDEIACAYLFGSQARGVADARSDIDLAVLFGQEPPATLDGCGFELAAELERDLDREVDLVLLNRAPVDLVHRVLRDGVLVHETDPSARVRFEVKARNEYFDLLPYLRVYRKLAARAE